MLAAADRDELAISRRLFLGTLAALRLMDVDVAAAVKRLGLDILELDGSASITPLPCTNCGKRRGRFFGCPVRFETLENGYSLERRSGAWF
jgi:hypothetical protein